MKLQEIITYDRTVSMSNLDSDVELVIDIQTQLAKWGLYPQGIAIDGDYNPQTKSALEQLLELNNLNAQNQENIDSSFAKILLQPNSEILIETAKEKEQVWQIFKESQVDFSEINLPFRDRLVENSPFYNAIATYPDRLKQKPDNIGIFAPYNDDRSSTSSLELTFTPYPAIGTIPNISETGLDFLDDHITEACVAVGNFVDGQIHTSWFGKNSRRSVQCWSTTKFIPLLYLISQLDTIDIGNCVVKNSEQFRGIPFRELAIDIVSYRQRYGSSNSLAAMFKRFTSYQNLDQWTKSLTGNQELIFQGRYGENPFYDEPVLHDSYLQQNVLQAQPAGDRGPNLVSAYDLTRLLSLLAWHYHLPQSARIPNARWYNVDRIVEAMGYDRCRYLDVAIERLGLSAVIKNPVIISKVGWGDSDERNCYEIVYTAFIQFIDIRLPEAHQLRNMALTLRSVGVLNPRDMDEEALILDARMAMEITEILRRIVVG